MKKNHILRALALGAFSSEEDTLWQKVVEIASENLSWIPESVMHYEEVYSRIGIRQEVTETHPTLRKQESGEVELTFHHTHSSIIHIRVRDSELGDAPYSL